ncbi:hypothetical protein [Mucilaginibacter flavus]|uniref:hypothetical protein n=1 Tax=Mucilaginibacter flavus TaxID=931504 RepID=UPI0025B4A95C|nr:hypothetical protein [Mucilaginibacter flavus]MDN3582723.1 hypothetical protein [Mucilaginibacter flavus]
MTTKNIEEQIAAIKAATSEASVSKETAMAFLKSAGIINESSEKTRVISKSSSTTKSK